MIKYNQYINSKLYEGFNEEFEIGDRVVALRKIDACMIEKDMMGTIINIQRYFGGQICVEWDDFIEGHSGNGEITGKAGHCWWVYPNTINVVSSNVEDEPVKIRWYSKGKLNESNFQERDRVVALRDIDGGIISKGSNGNVLIIDDKTRQICVEWDDFVGGHNGRKLGKENHCWWVFDDVIEQIEREPENEPVKIRWYKKGKLNESDSSDIKINVEGKNYLVDRLIDNLTLVVKKRKSKSLRIKGINGYVNKDTFTRKGKYYETHFELTLTNKDVIIGDYNSRINNICVKVNNEIIYDIDNRTFDNEVLIDKIVGEYVKYLKSNKYKINESSDDNIEDTNINLPQLIFNSKRYFKNNFSSYIVITLTKLIVNKKITCNCLDNDNIPIFNVDNNRLRCITFRVQNVEYISGNLIFTSYDNEEFLINQDEYIMVHADNYEETKDQIRWYHKGKLE